MGIPAEEGQQYFCIRLSTKKDMYVYADWAEVIDGSIDYAARTDKCTLPLPQVDGNIAMQPQPKTVPL